jgi:hypothetical protein
MGKGIKLADAGLHGEVMEELKEQLLIVFLKRLVDKNGELSVPIAEIDDTGQNTLAFSVNPDTRTFHFTLGKKS